jgi:hypothetical protein
VHCSKQLIANPTDILDRPNSWDFEPQLGSLHPLNKQNNGYAVSLRIHSTLSKLGEQIWTASKLNARGSRDIESRQYTGAYRGNVKLVFKQEHEIQRIKLALSLLAHPKC